MSLKWTDEEDKHLKILVEKGRSFEEIKKVLIRRTAEAMERRCYRLGIDFLNHKTAINVDEFKRLMKGK